MAEFSGVGKDTEFHSYVTIESFNIHGMNGKTLCSLIRKVNIVEYCHLNKDWERPLTKAQTNAKVRLSTKVPRQFSGEKNILFNKLCCNNMQKNAFGPNLTTYTKINWKWIKDLNVRA